MQLQLEFQIYHLLTGLAGGLVRGLVGIMKQTQNPDEFKIHWKYFGISTQIFILILISSPLSISNGLLSLSSLENLPLACQ